MRTFALICSLILAAGAIAPQAQAAGQLGLHLQPCAFGKAKVPARCGTFGVYENRQARTGRIIALHVIVLPAKHSTHRAIAEIAGGPGQAATEFAEGIATGGFRHDRSSLRDTYDYLFMDDRGMGTSNPFTCDLAPVNDPGAYLADLFPPRQVRACRRRDAASHDFAKYNTNNAVDDLDDLRAALGYPKLVLDGGSYGTFFSLVYMRRHPLHVQSAILDGVDPPHFQTVPGEPLGVQKAVDDLFTKCAGDARCRSHFPHFKEHFGALLARFDAGSISVPVRNTATKRVQSVRLSKEVFVDELRHLLYDPFPASYVPFIVERAYGGDYAPLARALQTAVLLFAHELNMGAFLSYSCADWMPFISPAQLAAARAQSFAGDLRYRSQQRACTTWNVPAMPTSFNDPVRSDAPVLMILGSDDPATPPQYGQAALNYLPNGKAVIVTGGGHGADTPCTEKLVVAFVQHNSAKGLNVSGCTSTFTLPPFATSMKGWPQL